MVKQAGTPEAIERFRALADPNRYQANAQQHKDELVQQGERILLQHELTANDPNLPTAEKKQAIEHLEAAMESVLWRIGEIDAILASFKTGQEAGMNRQMRRKLAKQAKRLPKSVIAKVMAEGKPADSEEDEANGDDYEEEEYDTN